MTSISKVALIALASLLIGCGGPAYYPQQSVVIPPPQDPCAPSYYSEMYCQTALSSGGYYHYGTFIPYPVGFAPSIFFYRTRYSSWAAMPGNHVTVVNFNSPQYTRTYTRPANAPTANQYQGSGSSVGGTPTQSNTAIRTNGSTQPIQRGNASAYQTPVRSPQATQYQSPSQSPTSVRSAPQPNTSLYQEQPSASQYQSRSAPTVSRSAPSSSSSVSRSAPSSSSSTSRSSPSRSR